MDNMVNKKIIAVIPARGGSKRIPKKNITDLGGKPMIAWTIEAALDSKYISQVIVSTDDEEIKKISLEYGAQVPFLREENADDHSPISEATIYTLRELEKRSDISSDITVQLMANCPLRGTEDIDMALENFVTKKLNFQISSFKYGWMNPWWAHEVNEKGLALPIFSEKIRMMRSQDQPELFCPTGAIWIANTQELFKAGSFYGKGYSLYPLHWIKAIDIDEYDDLEMAEYFFNKK
jgi:CMP-N-acetylneuraminic acid synthetase